MFDRRRAVQCFIAWAVGTAGFVWATSWAGGWALGAEIIFMFVLGSISYSYITHTGRFHDRA